MGLHRVHDLLVVATGAQVGRQDQHRVAEVHRPSLSIGQAAFVEDLQEDVEDVRVSLLHLVEEHDGVRATAHRLGQLTALVVADVSRRGTNQAGDGVLLAELGHVDADHRVLVVEEELR